MNECEVYRLDRGGKLCLHECVNVPGSYRCSCPRGYKLLHDGRSCEGEWRDGGRGQKLIHGLPKGVSLPGCLLAESNSCDSESGVTGDGGLLEARWDSVPHAKLCDWFEREWAAQPSGSCSLSVSRGASSGGSGYSVRMHPGCLVGSSRAETLRQTQGTLEGLHLPSSPGTPLCLRMLPPWPGPG